MRRSSVLRTAATLIVLAVSTAGCSLLSPSAVEFAIGTCLLLPEGEEITDYESVACEEVHDAEVFALPQHSAPVGASYPGEAALDMLAEERCREEFGDYVGLPYDESDLHATFLRPTAESWDGVDDREMVCLLVGEPVEVVDGPAGGEPSAGEFVEGTVSASEFGQLTGSKRGIAQ